VPDSEEHPTPLKPSRPASLLSVSLLVAAFTLTFHRSVLLFLAVWISGSLLLTAMVAWSDKSKERRARVQTRDVVNAIVADLSVLADQSRPGKSEHVQRLTEFLRGSE
jgi:hypothetical protein